MVGIHEKEVAMRSKRMGQTRRKPTQPPTSGRAPSLPLTEQLVVFLLLRLPGLWDLVDFTCASVGRGFSATAAGLSLFVGRIAALTAPIWVGPSHTFDG